MDAYLLDTSFISAHLNPSHRNHATATTWIQALSPSDSKIVSVITFGELEFGAELMRHSNGRISPAVAQVLREARGLSIENMTRHTSECYAEIKSSLAIRYMPTKVKQLSGRLRGWPEAWIDEFTGQKLQINENDLWICAAALEHNYDLVTFDKDMDRAQAACRQLRLLRLVSV